jgi:NADH-quinone oxidoreductase subunit J
MIEEIFFYGLGAVAIASAILVVTRRSPVVSALYLILNFLCLAGLYLTLNAQFIAIIQIIVYAGAIMVLFLFVIMLLNLGEEKKLRQGIVWPKVLGVGLIAALLMELLYIILSAGSGFPEKDLENAVAIGSIEEIGRQLFTTYLFPFEVTSLLLTAAIVGAVVLAKKKDVTI